MATKTKSGFDERRLALILFDYELILKAKAYDDNILAQITQEAKKAIEDTTVDSTRKSAERVLALAEKAAK